MLFSVQVASAEPRYPFLIQLTSAAENTTSKREQASFTLMLEERNCRFIKWATPCDCCPRLYKVIEKNTRKKAVISSGLADLWWANETGLHRAVW